MIDPPDDEEETEISRSATLGALLSIFGESLFGLTVIPLVLRSVLHQGGDPLPERIFLYIAGAFVTAGWLLLRGKPRGGAFRIPGGARAVKGMLSDVFYQGLAMFAVFCVSLVAIMILGTLLCALIWPQ